MTHCVVQLSGGVASWMAAKLVIKEYGFDNTTLLFADTKIEDADLYRFLDDIEAEMGKPVVRIAEGRTPWQVFRDKRFIGNSRTDPCSLVLKRTLLRKWMDEHHPDGCDVAVGIDYTEAHRCTSITARLLPHRAVYPLIDANLDKRNCLEELAALDIKAPALYDLGFPHNNCGGFCVKAGQAQFAHLLKMKPELYAHHEAEEESLREFLGKDVSIMRDHGGGTVTPLTMRDFRIRIMGGDTYERDEWGGCGCALDDGQPSQLTLDLFQDHPAT